MNLRKRILLIAAVAALVLDFVYVFIQRALTTSGALEGDLFHTLLVLIAFGGGGLYYFRSTMDNDQPPIQLIGRTVIFSTIYLLLIGIIQLSVTTRYVDKGGLIAAASFSTLVTTILIAALGGISAIVVFTSLSRLVFIKRRKNTRRNYIFFVGTGGCFILLEYLTGPNGFGLKSLEVFTAIAYGLTFVGILVNAFHFSWILVLTRREKMVNLLLSLFGFAFFFILSIHASGGEVLQNALRAYHPMLYAFMTLAFHFGTAYMGIGFASTLLHLPTAKEFDRKKMEISTLQNMSRLITQVFDFDELIATTTHLALEVSEGHAAWLELIPDNGKTKRGDRNPEDIAIVQNSVKNISISRIENMRTMDGQALQQLAFHSAGPVLIQDFTSDRRLDNATRSIGEIGTLVMVPLSSHGEIIGLLSVTKRESYAFDKDVVNVLAAFADMVSVAIENSTLIRESIVKERMEQELLVAQQMQRSLLPQVLPASPFFEIAARSIPAYEVGGDYYDVLPLDAAHIGFVVGDVSGKGVSAALYMAQVKGIFQSLSGNGASTRDILIRMNTPLCHSMERKSFISLLYAVLNIETGTLSFSRAGHCPLLHVRRGVSNFLQPEGMALGLDGTERFANSLREESLVLEADDIIVMYTDGVTEARNPQDEEFQYSRLGETVASAVAEPSENILNAILHNVKIYSERAEAEDDITVLVLRWNGVV
ncbi:MAG: PP2C family protein-serine/threonine phosphatase [Bacteroidota bacterium]